MIERPPIVAYTLLALLLVASGCARGETTPAAEDAPIHYTAELQTRTPLAESGLQPPFYNIVSAFRLPDDTFIVIDKGDLRFKRVRMDGTQLGSWGGKGSGPGEVRRISLAARLGESHFGVVDQAMQRVTRFGLESSSRGELETFRLPQGLPGSTIMRPLELTESGFVIWEVSERVKETSHPTGYVWRKDLLQYRLDGTRIRHLTTVYDRLINQEKVSEGRVRKFNAPMQTAPREAIASKGDLLFFSFSLEYEILVFDLQTGNLVQRITIPEPKVPVGREVDAVYPYHAEAEHGGFEINESSAFIMSLSFVDDDGRLWVRRIPNSFGQDRPTSDQYHYDIVDVSKGNLAGWVRTNEVRVFAAQGSAMFGFSNSIGDQGSLCVYQLTPN